MNETKLSQRQKYALNLINQSEGLGREELQKKLTNLYEISKPTLIRDLNQLIKLKLIKSQEKGKNVRYFSYFASPLLKLIDINQYFIQDPDVRIKTKKTFDFKIFDYLNNFFSIIELEKISQKQRSFSKEQKRLSPDIFKKELERFIIELSWKSSKIEGNTYTLLETEALIKEKQEAKGRQKNEAIMILNHKSAFEQILKHKSEFRKISLSQINQLHNLLIKGLEVSTGIRKQAVGITGTVYRPLDNEHQIKEVMEKLTLLINNNKNPLEKALIANSMISYIQPYADGNKRTGRMLTNAFLLAYDYFPLSYRSINEDEFKKALIIFYEQGSIYHLKKMFIEQLIFAYETYFR